MLKTEGMAGIIKDSLTPVLDGIDLAFIYGSQANGTATAVSDIDLLVAGDFDDIMFHRCIRKAEEKLGRSINYTQLSKKEFARRRNEKGGFLARVLEGNKILIHGETDEV